MGQGGLTPTNIENLEMDVDIQEGIGGGLLYSDSTGVNLQVLCVKLTQCFIFLRSPKCNMFLFLCCYHFWCWHSDVTKNPKPAGPFIVDSCCTFSHRDRVWVNQLHPVQFP